MIRIFSLLKLRMEYQIVIAIFLAVLAGVYFPDFAKSSEVLGTLYLNLLKFIIGPLLFFSIISSIVGIGSIKEMGKLGGLTFGIYMMTTFFAILVSLLMMNLFTPGVGIDLSSENFQSTSVATLTLDSFLLSLIPKNVIAPFLEGNMMQLVFVSILFAIAILAIADKEGANRLHVSSQTITDVVLKFTGWIIALTPIGIFGLIAAMAAKYGLDPLFDLWKFVLVVLSSLAFHLLLTLPLVAFLVTKINIYTYLFKLKNVILFAFSTASSSATLPLNLTETVSKGGVHKRIAELVLPIGSTINMDGTALYQAAVALFVAQGLGMDLSITQQITIALTVVLASVGAAGIPGAGIVMLTTVFATIGLPLEAIGIIMLVDRFLDMFRTAVNVSGDMIVTKIINHIYDKDLQKEAKSY
ncbi:MAG: dicarboxylate/amino acid:cation symporter [Thiovulaceae bacterium]|nr:dicarboxylate/amino acid:cation symporter [Sulfurimonadaceae bacterium]